MVIKKHIPCRAVRRRLCAWAGIGRAVGKALLLPCLFHRLRGYDSAFALCCNGLGKLRQDSSVALSSNCLGS